MPHIARSVKNLSRCPSTKHMVMAEPENCVSELRTEPDETVVFWHKSHFLFSLPLEQDFWLVFSLIMFVHQAIKC